MMNFERYNKLNINGSVIKSKKHLPRVLQTFKLVFAVYLLQLTCSSIGDFFDYSFETPGSLVAWYDREEEVELP